MEAGFVVVILVVGLVCTVVGYIFGKRKTERWYVQDTQYTQGTLNIDCSDPEFEPSLFLGLATPVKDIISRKYIALDVNVIQNNSHQ